MRTMTLIRVTGKITEPWLIGATAADATVNIPAVVDPRTKTPVLPATTLVGSLRDHLGPALAERWLGPPPRKDGTPDRMPSLLRVSPVSVDARPSDRRLRARTSVDGRRRAAKGRGLRQEQLVQRDGNHATRFGWTLEYAGGPDQDLLDALARWSPRIGRGQTVGRGRMVVDGVVAYGLDLSDRDQLTWWLSRRARDMFDDPLSAEIAVPAGVTPHRAGDSATPAATRWERQFAWQVADPLHVGGTDPGERPDGDRTALVRRVDRKPGSEAAPGVPIIPGSAWKGIFRHRAEHILNLVGAADADRIIGLLFGSPGAGRSGGRRGLLTFHTSEIRETGGTGLPVRHHVSIDRVSGGAADGLLFAMESVRKGRFQLVISSSTDLPAAFENLLKHITLDLHEGLIGVGGSTSRGYGTIRLRGAPPSAHPVTQEDLTGACTALGGSA